MPEELSASQLVGNVDWHEEQTTDPTIAIIVQCVADGKPWPRTSDYTTELRSLMREKTEKGPMEIEILLRRSSSWSSHHSAGSSQLS